MKSHPKTLNPSDLTFCSKKAFNVISSNSETEKELRADRLLKIQCICGSILCILFGLGVLYELLFA